ncbi:MBL fold metallo-hydrolase [Chlamydia trachomatis]|uniref:MBL fold metallo-hydrolase n=1 Tax=Chlamydia trachomatis TaxID=813 RepID=UPI0001B46DC3|nr:MBL fold metallo-hydrolase [Chlamydia trachomatis]ADH17535.1 Zn-dependent hydrolase [Chlamydia trachomatis E/150]ADH21227.1 Zn-dependent hydrolase [Chlamydia trachomatis E/11023]AGR99750.1 Zn-dependent hydrolase [Chlamydia trachomatis RC-F(s)/342]AGT64709.1 Zn-dependent hydrolase [Chlamydia trachomatis]AGT65638.1 Zn-dependent hydrolase [Chlamydia trachomatis]
MEGFFPIASGSKGNCAYLGTRSCKLLIDLGISKQAVTEALHSMGIHPEDIQGIFVTHEHSDHIAGLRSFIKTYRTPIICNIETARSLRQLLDLCPTFKIFTTGYRFSLEDLRVQTFNVPHDAVDPVGFIFQYSGMKLGFCTDLGWVTSWITHLLCDCDYLLIESNHDPEMVLRSSRPESCKQRILSKQGHISNAECGALLQRVLTPRIKKIYLAHLSLECNTAEQALNTVTPAIQEITDVHPVIAQSSGITDPIFFSAPSLV